ncbi:hypothetical protein COLO4_27663 [Corchorus olitorius]|uniref:Uncharacterized protein n=1 Tax=Corchorus olitorius TaxID=93759 RepID=A0A1R3HPJ5_9ROSI|nr:hypothetical protein COLO4_27663 [Corchorus olitorius]
MANTSQTHHYSYGTTLALEHIQNLSAKPSKL